MVFLRISVFLMGLFSLFAIPTFHRFILVDLFLLSSFFLAFIIILIKKIYFNKTDLFFLSISILYYAATQFGVLNSGSYIGLLSAQLFLLSFLTVFFISKILYNLKLLLILLKGFVYSAIITSLYCIIETIYFYTHLKSLNNVIFPKELLARSRLVLYTAFIHIGGLILYRPSGFSLDPSITIPGVFLAFMLVKENIIVFSKNRKLILFLLIIAIILSTAKTSIIVLILYFVFKIFQKKVLFLNKIKVNSLIIIFFISLFLLLYIGLFLKYNNSNEGNIRHLKYMSSIFYFYKQKPIELLFGYGYTGVGTFFNKYVSWFKDIPGFKFGQNLNPESSLIDILFFGGLAGLIFWISTFLYSLINGNEKIKLIILLLLFLMFGSDINSTWFNFTYISLFMMSHNKW